MRLLEDAAASPAATALCVCVCEAVSTHVVQHCKLVVKICLKLVTNMTSLPQFGWLNCAFETFLRPTVERLM